MIYNFKAIPNNSFFIHYVTYRYDKNALLLKISGTLVYDFKNKVLKDTKKDKEFKAWLNGENSGFFVINAELKEIEKH